MASGVDVPIAEGAGVGDDSGQEVGRHLGGDGRAHLYEEAGEETAVELWGIWCQRSSRSPGSVVGNVVVDKDEMGRGFEIRSDAAEAVERLQVQHDGEVVARPLGLLGFLSTPGRNSRFPWAAHGGRRPRLLY